MTEEKPVKKKSYYNDKKRQYDVEFQRKYVRQVNIKLSKKSDAELIAIYEQIEDKANFFRDAVRRYAEEHNIKTEDQ